jgi:hypothetical protein
MEGALTDARCYGFMPVFHVYFAEILRRRGTSEDLKRVSTLTEQPGRETQDGESSTPSAAGGNSMGHL